MTHWGPEWRDGADTRFRLWAPDREAVVLEIDGAPFRPENSGAPLLVVPSEVSSEAYSAAVSWLV